MIPVNYGKNDVLFGRGGATNNHSGNKFFRTIVADHQAEYLQARKRDKGAIALRIVRIVYGEGGRFLRRDPATREWIEVGEKRAAEKTSQALREGLDVRGQSTKSPTKRPTRQLHQQKDPSTSKQLEAAGTWDDPMPHPFIDATMLPPELAVEPNGIGVASHDTRHESSGRYDSDDQERQASAIIMPSILFDPIPPSTDCDCVVEV